MLYVSFPRLGVSLRLQPSTFLRRDLANSDVRREFRQRTKKKLCPKHFLFFFRSIDPKKKNWCGLIHEIHVGKDHVRVRQSRYIENRPPSVPRRLQLRWNPRLNNCEDDDFRKKDLKKGLLKIPASPASRLVSFLSSVLFLRSLPLLWLLDNAPPKKTIASECLRVDECSCECLSVCVSVCERVYVCL